MVLQFCPVCKSLLQLKEENGRTIGVCSCGFKRMSGVEISLSEKTNLNGRGQGIVNNNDYKEEIKKLTNKKEVSAFESGVEQSSKKIEIMFFVVYQIWNS
jgi:DNA-directed RNA polymerase subunit M/transcription elongation factor TFIIS